VPHGSSSPPRTLRSSTKAVSPPAARLTKRRHGAADKRRYGAAPGAGGVRSGASVPGLRADLRTCRDPGSDLRTHPFVSVGLRLSYSAVSRPSDGPGSHSSCRWRRTGMTAWPPLVEPWGLPWARCHWPSGSARVAVAPLVGRRGPHHAPCSRAGAGRSAAPSAAGRDRTDAGHPSAPAWRVRRGHRRHHPRAAARSPASHRGGLAQVAGPASGHGERLTP
jgi:hypothetical protein